MRLLKHIFPLGCSAGPDNTSQPPVRPLDHFIRAGKSPFSHERVRKLRRFIHIRARLWSTERLLSAHGQPREHNSDFHFPSD